MIFTIDGKQLEQILIAKRWDARDLARAADISEAGARLAITPEGRRFRPKTIYALADALGVEPSRFAVVEG